MIIYCANEDEFFEAIRQLVTKGLTFEAMQHSLKIKLLGGY